jgi:lysophospholipase L1-like esterase
MRPLLDHFTAFMNDVCTPTDSACTVVNEVRGLDWRSSDFVDEGHFSLSGGRKFAAILAEAIAQQRPSQ